VTGQPGTLGRACSLADRGEYASSWRLLDADQQVSATFAAVLKASMLRQLGLHSAAAALDVIAWQAAAAEQESAWAALGLSADWVGRGDWQRAGFWLRKAEAGSGSVGVRHRDWWDMASAHAWVSAEVALLEGRPADAVGVLARVPNPSPARLRQDHHRAKTALFLAASFLTLGDKARARPLVDQCLALAQPAGLQPLCWPAHRLAVDIDPTRATWHKNRGERALDAIAASLPEMAAPLWRRP